MTDKELLELAAKAAGIEGEYYSYSQGDWGLWIKVVDGLSRGWNPLTDDGDALRLAVKLGLPWESGYALGRTDYWKIGEEYVRHDYEGSDVTAATRRAIIRAAAEIGRNMK